VTYLKKLKADRDADRLKWADGIAKKLRDAFGAMHTSDGSFVTRTDLRLALLAATEPPPGSVPVKAWVNVRRGISFTNDCSNGFSDDDTHQSVAWIDCLPVAKIPTAEATPCS